MMAITQIIRIFFGMKITKSWHVNIGTFYHTNLYGINSIYK